MSFDHLATLVPSLLLTPFSPHPASPLLSHLCVPVCLGVLLGRGWGVIYRTMAVPLKKVSFSLWATVDYKSGRGGVGLWSLIPAAECNGYVKPVTVFHGTLPLPLAHPFFFSVSSSVMSSSVGREDADIPCRTVLLTFGSGQVSLRCSVGWVVLIWHAWNTRNTSSISEFRDFGTFVKILSFPVQKKIHNPNVF